MAKDFLSLTTNTPRPHKVESPAWSLQIAGQPLIHNIDQTLYDLVHTTAVKKYLIGKSRISEDAFDSVEWTRLGQAINRMKLP
jgi:hypothetical protein